MPAHPSVPSEQLEAVCNVLGATTGGLTGSEIGGLLHDCGIDDPEPNLTKRYRLFEALNARQRTDGCSNAVLAFIRRAMAPVSYRGEQALFDDRRHDLNEVLAFAGLHLTEDGQLRKVTAARTLSEAQERAGRLRAELTRRRVHADVLKFCRAELLQENYFHAVLEATKSLAEKVREKTGLTNDGAGLFDAAFGMGKGAYPMLAFNSLQTESERMEHTGLMTLMKGTFGTFRNPTAHAPKTSWKMSEHDALDLRERITEIAKIL